MRCALYRESSITLLYSHRWAVVRRCRQAVVVVLQQYQPRPLTHQGHRRLFHLPKETCPQEAMPLSSRPLAVVVMTEQRYQPRTRRRFVLISLLSCVSTIYKLDTETKVTKLRNPRAWGCSVLSKARALLRARGFLNRLVTVGWGI